MKIAYLSSSIIPSRYANSVHVMKMCQAFAKNGHDVSLFARYGKLFSGDDFRHYGVEKCFHLIKYWRPRVLPKKIRISIYTAIVMRKLKQLCPQPDIIYGRDLDSLVSAASLRIPLIYESHDSPENKPEKAVQEWLFLQDNFVRLVVISDALRQEYLRLFPWLSSEKIIVAHDGADLPQDTANAIDASMWPGRQSSLQVGYIGSLYPGRGIEIILDLADQFTHMDFHIVGGMEKDIAYWKKNISSSNLYFHGFVSHGELQKFYRFFDVVVAPYQKKVMLAKGKGDTTKWMSPLKIFEYMAMAKPIIASDLPVLHEVLTHRENALLVTPDNLDEWSKALNELETNAALRCALAKKAFTDIASNFTWEKRAKKVLDGLALPNMVK